MISARWLAAGLASALALAGAPAIARDTAAVDQTVTILVTGDVGLNPSNAPVNPRTTSKGGRTMTWGDTTADLNGLIDGDLNFLNVETVVTDRNDLPADRKGQSGPFNFRTHPNAFAHLVETGFNVFSLANNHSMDYGPEGLEETLNHMEPLYKKGLLAAAGIGRNREQASRPFLIDVRGSRIAFAAIGIVTNNLERHRAGPDKPGQIAYRFDADWAEVQKRLIDMPANYRILSIHYGQEGYVQTDQRQITEWRREAALKNGIDLIVGHHAHVVRGVEIAGKSVIFYGLGNFLHHGTANMTGNPICKDYGLMGKVHLKPASGGRLEVRAIEALPMTNTHFRPKLFAPAAAAAHIHALNYLSARLDDSASGTRGVRFTPMPNSTGLYCVPGAEKDPGRIGKLCRDYKPAPPIPGNLLGAIAGSCGR